MLSFNKTHCDNRCEVLEINNRLTLSLHILNLLHVVTTDDPFDYQPTINLANRPLQRFLAAQRWDLSLLTGFSALSSAYHFEHEGLKLFSFPAIGLTAAAGVPVNGIRWTCWSTLTSSPLSALLRWGWPQCQILLSTIIHNATISHNPLKKIKNKTLILFLLRLMLR